MKRNPVHLALLASKFASPPAWPVEPGSLFSAGLHVTRLDLYTLSLADCGYVVVTMFTCAISDFHATITTAFWTLAPLIPFIPRINDPRTSLLFLVRVAFYPQSLAATSVTPDGYTKAKNKQEHDPRRNKCSFHLSRQEISSLAKEGQYSKRDSLMWSHVF